MAQNMKLSVNTPDGQNLTVIVHSNDTFKDFKEKLKREYNLFINIDDFRVFDQNLKESDNFFNCLISNLSAEDLVNIENCAMYEINLQHSNLTVQGNNSGFLMENLDTSLIVLNDEKCAEYTSILSSNIFDPNSVINESQQNIIESYDARNSKAVELQLLKNDQNTYSVVMASQDQKTVELQMLKNNEASYSVVMEPNNEIKNPNAVELQLLKNNQNSYNVVMTTNVKQDPKTVKLQMLKNNKQDLKKVELQLIDNAEYEENVDDFSLIEAKLQDMHAEVVTDYCRLCSENIKDAKNVLLYSNSAEMAKIVNEVFPVKVFENDTLPQQICEPCNESLNKHYQFFKAVLKADETLRAKFKPVEIIKNTSSVDDSQLLADILEGQTSSTVKSVKHELLDDSKDYEPEYLDESDSDAKLTQNCRLCDLIIDNLQDAIIHSVAKHHIDNLYACIYCNYGFTTSKLLSDHFNTDHKKNFIRKFKCKRCFVNYASQQLLQTHVCGHHKYKPSFDCDACSKCFTTALALKKHKKTHRGGKNFPCKVCKKLFLDKQTLKDHEVSHMATKPFQCHICGKSLNRLSRLRKHLSIHNNNLVMKDVQACSLCKEVFQSESNASVHVAQKHDGINYIETLQLDKVFRCEFCEKCYKKSSVLNQHRLEHTGDRPFVCHICHAEFSSFARCTTHKASHGIYQENCEKIEFPVVRFFLCEHCGKTYLHWSYLQMHRKLKHPTVDQTITNAKDGNPQCIKNAVTNSMGSVNSNDPIKCAQCNITLDTNEALKEHCILQHTSLKTQEYRCGKCDKIFTTQIQLDNHLKLHNTKKENKCTMCPKSFISFPYLVEHMKYHPSKKSTPIKPKSLLKTNNDRPHECDICGVSFLRLSNLTSHKENHSGKKNSNFVLMLGSKLDEVDNTVVKTANPIPNILNTVVSNNSQPEAIEIATNAIDPNLETANYFDLGDGNYIQVQGNTVNIDGKDYLILPDNQKTTENYEMLVDNSLNQSIIQNGETYATHSGQLNNTIMLMDTAENAYMIPPQPVQNDLIFASGNQFPKTITSEGATYIIGNEFMLNEPTFTVN